MSTPSQSLSRQLLPPRFIAASWTGERHQRAAQPCCDAVLLHSHGFVICDGAGGTPAVARAAGCGSRAAWRALLAVQRALARHERRPGGPPLAHGLLQRRFHAGFLNALGGLRHHKDHTVLACLWDRRRLLVAQVGDSSLLVRRDGRWQLAIAPHKGECANETTFLRASTPPQAIALWWVPADEVDAVIGFSDGLEAAFLSPSPAAPEQLRPNTDLAELLLQQHRLRCGWKGYGDWLKASLADPALASLSDDDRSLVIAAC